MLIHWIWLSTCPELNNRQKKQLLEKLGDPEKIYCAEKTIFAEVDGLPETAVKALLDKDLTHARTIMNQCTDKKIGICTYGDNDYPRRLRHISDPPLVLYYKGTLPDLEGRPILGAVGTRRASAYGMTVAQRMGYQMTACGAAVVSGAADGVDAAAMRGALMAGGTVVGVLGCGVDVVYPKKNSQLFADMVRQGCLISEFPPQTPPYKWNFPQRNRIISGMSNGVVVIEAPLNSGSMITARSALEQGRDVFCVPGNVDMPTFEGSNALLREGAIAVRDGWDVLSEYTAVYPGTVTPQGILDTPHIKEYGDETTLKVSQKPYSPAQKLPSDKKKEKKPIDNKEKPPYSDVKDVLPFLPEDQQMIVELLTSARLVDELIAETGLSAAKVGAALTVLEIKGIVRRLPGKRVALK